MTTARENDTAPTAEAPLSREAYTLLAQANLLRMRGRWEEAVEKCMAALRLAPDNASAQSLLGDIYENQGRYDDAVQWYRMALDVNPDSPADKIKLGRLLTADPRRRLELTRAETFPVNKPTAPPDRARASGDADRVLRGVAWLAAALIIVTVVLGGIAMSKRRLASGVVTTPPVVVSTPPANPDGSAASRANSSAPNSTDSPASLPPTAIPPADAADPAESALLQTLQQDSSLTAQNITPVGVQMDPRQSSATVTVLCPAPPADLSVRDALARDAAEAALAGDRAQGDRIAAWTIRCLIPASSDASASAPSLAFVADTTTSEVSPLGTNGTTLSSAQILNAFHNVWWSPAVPQ